MLRNFNFCLENNTHIQILAAAVEVVLLQTMTLPPPVELRKLMYFAARKMFRMIRQALQKPIVRNQCFAGAVD